MYELFSPAADGDATPLAPEDFDTLDQILDDLRTRLEETPQWEFCEGFMVALLCARTPVPPGEYLPLLLGLPGEGEVPQAGEHGTFQDEAQMQRFAELWRRRWQEVQAALDADVQTLDDERCLHPELADQRGALLDLPEAERGDFVLADLPALGQVWALGFMFAVETWAEDWAPPRDRDLAEALDASLQTLVALTEDDTAAPEVSPFGDGPPSVSQERINLLADAIWAAYDLRALARELGPRVATVRAAPVPGRNEACPCGSGKKYKKCCGA